jgi:hypothetical protein
VEKGTITISGEELLENAQRNRDKRALSTNDPVPLDTDTIGTADCRLIAIGGRQRLHSSFRPKTVLAVGIFDAVVGSLLCVGSILLFQRVRDLEFWSGSVRLNAPVLRVVGAAFLAVGLLYLWRGVYHLIVAARSAP